MIRAFTDTDMEPVLDIWLNASLKAHDFISPNYWQSQVDNMRSMYLPASEVYVWVEKGTVKGFYALYENQLAAIFVKPDVQGKGIGKALISHAKKRRESLSLNVYKRNDVSYRFYLSQGFRVIGGNVDEHTGEGEWVMGYEAG
ncbi:N-acetyltransferase [Photobacterium sp. WH24]|uniref:N-acetyltransferase n=1 Tax=Photobacterium sp. WH24 TaxID=2827237 RepID=UPI001C47EF88|nr:N-acetyltransferase [Photobacterium sp. WH24]MBV7263435.1 N-acetyltransferase [Photobacterium sp. WH24]